MDRAELVELLSPEGLRLLDGLPEWDAKADIVKIVADLRKQGHPPGLVATVLSQARLRHRAKAKFGPFASRMLFTEPGLEQATRLQVAALHAGRFARAGIGHVADLGCGIGGDALAMAAIDLEVTAAEADEVTAAIAAYNLTPFPRVQRAARTRRAGRTRRHRRAPGSIRLDARPRAARPRGSPTPPSTPPASTSPSGSPTAWPSA